MKTALVMAGGGSRGAYQAGCIKALEELNFHFDIVTGTSIGALNGIMVVQKDFDGLYDLWKNLTAKDVFKNEVDIDLNPQSMLDQKNMIISFFKSFINEKGADITPLKEKIYSLYNDEKFFASDIDYGLVTVTYPKLTPLEIKKQDMKPGEPVEYGIASGSCFPIFPVFKFNDQGYIDGGYFDNCPISLAYELGAEEILTIEVNQVPTHRYYWNRPNIRYIMPHEDMGSWMDFSHDVLMHRYMLGYLDALKVFNKLEGYMYAFSNADIDHSFLKRVYKAILNYENSINRGIINNQIRSDIFPLTEYLTEITHKDHMTMKDYTITALEVTMHFCNYPTDQVYDFNKVLNQISTRFSEGYNKFLGTSHIAEKDAGADSDMIPKNSHSIDIIFYLYNSLMNHHPIDRSSYKKALVKEYIIATFIYAQREEH